jgi:carboxypeptidase family protein
MKAALAFALLLLSTTITSVALAQELNGQISGVVVDAAWKPLANQRVELRKLRRQGPAQFVTTTDANGAFTYKNLRPGRYEVELIIEGRAVARSRPVELSVGRRL